MAKVLDPPGYGQPTRWRAGPTGQRDPDGVKAGQLPWPQAGAAVAKMASYAIFQYNVLAIDIDNTTLGLI